MMMDLGSVKKDFSNLLSQVQPWTLSHFVMWLDIKVAEYKVFGRMIMDNTPYDTPHWLKVSADYLAQQQKETHVQAAVVQGGDKELISPDTSVPPLPLSPRSTNTVGALRPTLEYISSYDPAASFVTGSSAMYSSSVVNVTTLASSVSPVYSTISHICPPQPVDAFQKPSVPIVATSDIYAKSATMAQYTGYSLSTQRIPSISHLSPKNIRQSHFDQGLTMSLPVSLASNVYASKEALTTAEVESQIAALESQIAAVNRSLKQSAHVGGVVDTAILSSCTGKSGRRKADTTTNYQSTMYVPQPYPKKSRHQSPVSASSNLVVDTPLPPLHPSMDLLARMHQLDTESVPESLRSQNIQQTLEAFESLRTQTFPPSMEALRAQIANGVKAVQNTAQDMSLHQPTSDHDQLTAYASPVECDQTYALADQEHSYTPMSDSASASYNLHCSEVRVKVEAGQSNKDSMGVVEGVGVKGINTEISGDVHIADATEEDCSMYPVSMYTAANSISSSSDEKLAAEISTKKMRRKFLESMKNSDPKYYSHQIQQIIPFPEKFPVTNLDYGLKALQMIQTGEITRAGKIQLVDTIFHELIKYTGLYPTPTQKMAVANAIVETFPTLAAKMKASHISPADSWYVILCDKFRNERRGLCGAGALPRLSKGKKDHYSDASMVSMAADQSLNAEPMEETNAEPTEVTHNSTSQPSVTSSLPIASTMPSHYMDVKEAAVHAAAEAAIHAAYHQTFAPAQIASGKETNIPDTMSEEDDDDDDGSTNTTGDVKHVNAEERKICVEKAKRVRRKTYSPKRVQKAADMPVLDETYAASLLEYYSKHKPYYPVDADFSRHMDAEASKALAEAAVSQAAVSQAIAQAVASHAVGNHDEPYSAEVSAIVQTVVNAHIDEVLAARNYQGIDPGSYSLTSTPPEVEGTVEVKTSKKKVKIQQKERNPEQLQLTLQRFKQKLAVTYPGVQAVDDTTLLCTCGAKVKLGRARMLHNYSNYHLKRCPNPPITVGHECHSPSSSDPMSFQSPYPHHGSPGELNIPTTGPKVIAKKIKSAAYAGLSAADRETIQKHFLVNVPMSSTDTLVSGSASSTPPSQSLDLSMPIPGHNVLNISTATSGPCHCSVSIAGQNGNGEDLNHMSEHEKYSHKASDGNSPSVLNVPLPWQSSTYLYNSVTRNEVNSRTMTESVPLNSDAEMTNSQSLDLSVQSSGPSVLIEHHPGSDLRLQIPQAIVTSISEYSGELPDLSAMNALALIQGKVDRTMETSYTNEQVNACEEPINLADC